ncbi:hypothetical protein Glove_606g78 [Diversispora epigaea]|uniref:Serine-threonine/tyrosine-protein kinase catalytic domain-containing protein n=1 Tax=Diversispora epigaea TaxID=1348612 RepID=A0A397GB81_9GLOM|nr:hypothetical protein Glove_606g78 [Diversispora epigaea]
MLLKADGKFSRTKASTYIVSEFYCGKSQGNREIPIQGTSQNYVKIYKDCWNQDPDQRPNIEKVIQDLEHVAIESNTLKISSISRPDAIKSAGAVEEAIKSFVSLKEDLRFTYGSCKFCQDNHQHFKKKSTAVTKFLEIIGGDIVDQNQKINTVLREVSLMKEILNHSDGLDKNIKGIEIKSTELSDPLTSKVTDRRGENPQVIKKIYRNFEVACKPIDLQNEDAAKIQGEIAILENYEIHPTLSNFMVFQMLITVKSWYLNGQNMVHSENCIVIMIIYCMKKYK